MLTSLCFYLMLVCLSERTGLFYISEQKWDVKMFNVQMSNNPTGTSDEMLCVHIFFQSSKGGSRPVGSPHVTADKLLIKTSNTKIKFKNVKVEQFEQVRLLLLLATPRLSHTKM